MVSVLRKQRDSDRKQKTYQELVNAAVEVFSAKGYHETLISDIVAKAQVGQGTFYRNFKGKREVMETILAQFGETLLGQFDFMTASLPQNATEYRQASLEAVLAMARTLENNRKLVLLIIREAPTVDREFEQHLNDLLDQFASLAGFYLEHAINQGFARKCNPQVVAQALVGMALRHITVWLRSEAPALNLEQLIAELIDFAFFGFGVEEACVAVPKG